MAKPTCTIKESHIPISDPVQGACEILGLDPLYVANEGRFVLFLPAGVVDRALSLLHQHPISKHAIEIGTVQPLSSPQTFKVTIKTIVGTTRILDLLSGEQLPRIC